MLPGLAVSEPSVHVGFVMFFVVVFLRTSWLSSATRSYVRKLTWFQRPEKYFQRDSEAAFSL